MHIIHVYKTFYGDGFGGVAQVIRQIAAGIQPYGVRTSVIALKAGIEKPEQVEHEGITVHYYPLDFQVASNGFSFSVFKDYRRLAATADILHYHFPWPTGDLLHQLAPKGSKALVTYHSDIVRQAKLKLLYAPLMNRFLSQMQAIISTSPNYVRTSQVLQRYNTVEVIPIGLGEATYPVPDSALLAQWAAKLPANFFLFVGALRYYKGLHTLIDAARQNGLPVVVAGCGGQEHELRDYAKDVSNVHFLGEVSELDKAALFKLCSAFVFPSHLRSEAFGISLLEAAMYSKPMISCEIGSGMSYINLHEVTGFGIAPQDAGQLSAAMQALHDDAALRERFGAAARQRYEQLFTGKTMAEAYFALYKKLLSTSI